MIIPAMAFFVMFLLFPIFKAFQFSLYQYSGFGELTNFVGLDNYREALRDPTFFRALRNNLLLAISDTAVSLTVGFLLAYFLSRKAIGWRFLNISLFVPALVSVAVVATLWKEIYDPIYGLLNSFLELVGLGSLQQNWLGAFETALPSVIAAWVWRTIPFNMLILFANILRIPRELMEAAYLDGARESHYIRHIVLPMVSGVVGLLAVLSISRAFRAFDLVWVLTRGGPVNATEIATSYVYKQAFSLNRYGYGNALAFIVMLLLFATVGVALTFVRRRARRRA